MTALPLVDTNVFVRHLRGDHPDHSARATAFLARIERGEVRACTTDTVIFETVFTLERFYQIARPAIRDGILALLDLPGLILPRKRRYHQVFVYYVTYGGLSFADAFHATRAQEMMAEMVSFDRGLDRVPGLRRVEP